jgi:hypothetical protein
MELPFFMQGLRKGNLVWGGGSFSGDFERHVKRALEMGHLSLCRGSVRGSCRAVSFLGTLRDM